MTTGKTGAETGQKRRLRPFPVKQVISYLCLVLKGFEGILRVMSLYLYKNNIIDRKWMNMLIFITNLLQYLCSSLSKLDKLKAGDK